MSDKVSIMSNCRKSLLILSTVALQIISVPLAWMKFLVILIGCLKK